MWISIDFENTEKYIEKQGKAVNLSLFTLPIVGMLCIIAENVAARRSVEKRWYSLCA